ncbi:MAG: hypothetical protein HYR67_02360 [Bacteroidetes bacterium]|nr:hypothetical protein [Bacteroidota bacterium]
MDSLERNTERRSPVKKDLHRLKEWLGATEKSGVAHQVFIGFDGFVDKIQKAVKQKRSGNNLFFNSIHEFSEHIDSLTGRSGQIELVTIQTKAGGNAPILSSALGELNVKSFCIGSMGFPRINPLFQNITPQAEISSINAPGNSQAIEFNDGKIILSDLSGFIDYDWNYVKKNSDLEKIRSSIRSCDLVALVDWSNLPNATDIWQGLLHDVIKVVNRKDFYFVFDLCDPSRRNSLEIDEMLDLISSLSHYGKVTLALNENEARKIWMALSGNDQVVGKDNSTTLFDIGSFIFYTMTIDTLLIHPRDRVFAFQKNKTLELTGRLVKEPKVQTGGGDNFNAGYCLGLMSGLPMDQLMLLSMTTAGAYVQNGKSACIKDLINYLNNWATEIEKQKDFDTMVA